VTRFPRTGLEVLLKVKAQVVAERTNSKVRSNVVHVDAVADFSRQLEEGKDATDDCSSGANRIIRTGPNAREFDGMDCGYSGSAFGLV